MLLFRETGDGYALVDDFPITRTPVVVLPETSNGWSDLVRLESGGGMPPTYVTHAYDGERYGEKTRVPATDAPEGLWVLTGEFTYDDGAPLEPRD